MKSTTTYLHFNGNGRTAMAFYRECFGGELEVVAYPDASGKPNTDPKAPVQHSMIAQDGQALLMASDYPPGSHTSSLGNNFSVFIECRPAEQGWRAQRMAQLHDVLLPKRTDLYPSSELCLIALMTSQSEERRG